MHHFRANLMIKLFSKKTDILIVAHLKMYCEKSSSSSSSWFAHEIAHLTVAFSMHQNWMHLWIWFHYNKKWPSEKNGNLWGIFPYGRTHPPFIKSLQNLLFVLIYFAEKVHKSCKKIWQKNTKIVKILKNVSLFCWEYIFLSKI